MSKEDLKAENERLRGWLRILVSDPENGAVSSTDRILAKMEAL